MDGADHHRRRREQLPLLLLHRTPNFPPSLFPFIHTAYYVIDPHADPPDPSFPTLSKSVPLMLIVGPSPLTTDDLDRYPSVECVVGSSAGLNHVDLAACRLRGIRVTGAGDSYSDDVADYAVGLAIDVQRRISAGDRFVRSGSWPALAEYTYGRKITGKRVGIVGLGSIGSRIAKRFEDAFKCSISYTSRTMKPHNSSYTYYANAQDLASNVDILILCCSLTDETHHVINKDVMRALGKGIIVNVGRGPLIDEKEMVKLLVRGELGGAGLDVFEHEPHVPDELKALDNVVLSPHCAVMTPESFADISELVRSNLEAFYSNKPLKAQV